LPSAFAVTDFAAGAVGVAAAAIAELIAKRCDVHTPARVDRRLASMWFGFSVRPQGWELPPAWDAVAGDYATKDGWIRLHTNAPHHRKIALSVLNAPEDKSAVATAVSHWKAEELESAIVQFRGCAAAMRSIDEWRAHPQGMAVAAEPLVHREKYRIASPATWTIDAARPLADIRVLDLTRVLAGPVATRFLAGFGADVLRIDPPDWDEPSLAPEVTLGKRCAKLDLRSAAGIATFEKLLAEADVLVHGYRPGALESLGLDYERRRSIRPQLIDVSLDAYGFDGPWHGRRGFDSLVQMSCGIADAGMRRFEKARPFPLPVQALDQATGYLLAAAVIRGITTRLEDGAATTARTSLARVAHSLIGMPAAQTDEELATEGPADLSDEAEGTEWGAARRLRAPLTIDGTPMRWELAPSPLGSSQPEW
jgi:crotonobetainyl-CoA:carnitine CoA-transferase CaiB-like acyl-CoA transferase